MRLKKWGLGWSLVAVVCSMTFAGLAQESAPVGGAAVSTVSGAVPGLINYSSVLIDANGKPISGVTGVTFLLYKDEQGGAPVWIETQNITPDKSGHYTVTLGATKIDGSLADSFANSGAHWLGVQIVGQQEQARVLLVAVPYALKAGDAQTIGGLPPSAFVLAAPASPGVSPDANSATSTTTSSTAVSGAAPPASNVTTTGGTVNALPLFTTATNIQNSAASQTGSGSTAKIGIGTTAPGATLDVKGTANIQGILTAPATGTATSTGGKPSQAHNFVASSFNSGTASAVNQTFQWKAEPAGNNTTTPSGTLNLLFGSGTSAPAETGLKLSSKGLFTFATGQTFPGTGTITGVTTASGSGLSGGGTSGTLSLKVPSAGITNTMLQNSKITLNANTAGGITTPGAMTLGSTYTIGLKPCAANQVLQYSGTTWNCAAAGTGTVTSVGSGAGLTGGPITGSGTLSIVNAGVTNTMLQNSSLTVAAGTDLTGGGSVALGGVTTLNLDTTKVPLLSAANTFVGNQAVIGNLSATSEVSAGTTPTGNVASGTVEVDAAAINNGSWSPALNFGGGGEVIASDRAGSSNQYGLDFFTSYTPRLSITNTGLVGIGVQSPGWMLEVDPPNDSRIFGSAIFGANDTGSGVGASYALYAAGGYDITNISFNSGGLGGFLVGGSSNVGFGGDGLDAYAGGGALANGYAGYFSGDVYVSGNLSKNSGSFKIDHPLDPANKYLYHSFVESPDMMNIYNGNVMLDANGEAVIELPEWFGSLNRDYRYQLTCIGGFAPVYVAEEISNNQFKIAGGKAGMKVSWQVTGVRQDAWANAHRIPVEVEKAARERGYYLHPELYGAPEEKNIEWARHPEVMQRMKARQAKLAAQSKQR